MANNVIQGPRVQVMRTSRARVDGCQLPPLIAARWCSSRCFAGLSFSRSSSAPASRLSFEILPRPVTLIGVDGYQIALGTAA
jgi:hypothetical protein